jgi:hypothetical protein
VINSCCGESVFDQDPTIVDQLKERYANYQSVLVHNYPSTTQERRIMLYPGGGGHVYHIEVDVPPGCYVVWTRICYRGNEETNKVMVIVGCGDEVCVNLLLDAVETCAKNDIYPFLEDAVDKKVPKRDLKVVAKVLMDIADKPKAEALVELNQRLKDAKDIKDTGLEKAIGTLVEVVKGTPGPQQQQGQ